MVFRDELTGILDGILNPQDFADSTRNGLQVEGKDRVTKVGFSVDIGLEIIMSAAELNCDMIVSHHGLIWKGLTAIEGIYKSRIECLLKNDMNLYISHLPLDRNQVFGNNAGILLSLNAESVTEFDEAGFIGEFKDPLRFQDLLSAIRKNIGDRFIYLHYNNEKIKRIAVSSGSLKLSSLDKAIGCGVSTILSGEGMGESMFYYPVKENNMNIIFAGHYQTEVFGVKALMNELKRIFKDRLEVVFLDFPYAFEHS